MFSVSTIYSARDFLRLVSENELSTNQFLSSFQKYQYDSAPKVLQLVTECGWIHLNLEGKILLSEKGKLLASLDYKSALVRQLEDMILIYNPDWASFFPKGRDETIRFLPEGPKQCLKEAGFMNELSDDLIKIWDKLALAYRNYSNQLNLETGRIGEKMSIVYEKNRTGKKPRWQAVESNLSGYDILSVANDQDYSPLLIEVKSTTSKIEFAKFFITKNEWKVALNSPKYVFHLWVLDAKTQHFIVPVEKIKCHIPYDNGSGEWETVQIPFKAVI